MKEIDYLPALLIRNLDQLPRGTGARYLECVHGRNGDLIAKAWRRTKPKRFAVLVDMKPTSKQP